MDAWYIGESKPNLRISGKGMNSFQNPTTPFWKQPESRRLEFKERFPGGDRLARTAVAFANGAGGRIVFGIRNEPREIIGIADDGLFSLEERISNHIFSRCVPAIVPEIYIQAVEGKNLLVVEVFPGSQKPYYLKSKGKHKGAYVRIGSSNRQASEEMLEALERQRRKISFDAVPVYDLSFRDLDLTRFKADYRKATGRALNHSQLKNLGLWACSYHKGNRSILPMQPFLCLIPKHENAFSPTPKWNVPGSRERTLGNRDSEDAQ